ncbi:MAG TPA: class I SAM-dependent methyltransferase [Chloroflexota bacterium]|nr:class I SAM-dependent methyltransferase [Chloroflexota bacterium]
MSRVAERNAPIVAGDIDWAARWRSTVEARHAADATVTAVGRDRWDGRAARFAHLTRSLDAATDPFVLALRRAVRPTDSVLDVGAGAGRYALAIAPDVGRVTAVEPSPGMRAAFEEEARARGVQNVRLVPGTWDEAVVEPHDVAFVANVLYFVPDAVSFIDKLDRSATRVCFILHRVEEMGSVLGPVWDEIGSRRAPEAGFLELYNLLFSLGIRPDVELVRSALGGRYDGIDDAIAEARQYLGIAASDTSHDARIRESLAESLVTVDGRLGFARRPQLAIISWEK